MTQERPRGSPLHGKRVYAYVGQTAGSRLEFVSFATEFGVNLTPQNTARAVVMGSDAVPDVEIHGLVARARINLLLTSTESDMLLAISGTATDQSVGTQEVDYDKAVRDLLVRSNFVNAARLDVVLAPLENAPATVDASIPSGFTSLRQSPGYVIELNSAAIVGLEITGRVGEYTTARLEVESGRFRINAVEEVPST